MKASAIILIPMLIFSSASTGVYAFDTCASVMTNSTDSALATKNSEALKILDSVVPSKEPSSETVFAAQRLTEVFGKDFRILALHPGIASRLEAFIKFTQNQKIKLSPQEAFHRFKNHLGNIVLTRALRLTDEEFLNIKSKGLISNAQRSGLSHDEILSL